MKFKIILATVFVIMGLTAIDGGMLITQIMEHLAEITEQTHYTTDIAVIPLDLNVANIHTQLGLW